MLSIMLLWLCIWKASARINAVVDVEEETMRTKT
jgi:hypothetical protein